VALAREADAGEPLALATVVQVQGSAYRRPGARMLMTASGRTAGMISGGCLEGDVRERARQVMASGQACLVTYDSTAADDIVFGLGLGCNGIVHVLIEPLTAGDTDGPLTLLDACLTLRRAGQIATVFRAEGGSGAVTPGMRLLRWPDGRVSAGQVPADLIAGLAGALDAGSGEGATPQRLVLADGTRVNALIETVAPPLSLVIFGAGDDAIPVVQFAHLLGWHVTVADARPAYAVSERFPMANAVHCLRAENVRACPPDWLSADIVAMVMTHSYSQDRELLQALLPRRLRYLGLLGPKARTQRLLNELAAEGITFSPECLSRLHAPAGLDIGAETPEEIALALLAEIRSTLAGRSGGPLELRNVGIHDVEQSHE
jgi:xanthine/CO dehydrogenase XdhC/CoxF family maturation factor